MHVVIVTRWRERYADYASYVDHRAHRVTYVASEVGRGSIPPPASDVRIVPRTDDLDAVRQAVDDLASRHGAPDRIIALKEDDLLVGARLRQEWGCPGPTPGDLIPFRDKHVMARRIAAAGLPIEPFELVRNVQSVLDFAQRHGWPVVLKPLSGSASEGVEVVRSPQDLTWTVFGNEGLLVQKYNPNHVYHADGLFDGGRLLTWRASRNITTCLEFRHGSFLGTVEEDDGELNRVVGASVESFLRALTRKPTVFHLELFVDPASACTFLEVGARVGGGETALLWREVHGFDLMEQAFLIQSGLDPDWTARRVDQEVCGYLLIPSPLPRPCRITYVTPMLGRSPRAYAESLPRLGQVLPGEASFFEHVGGRFRFRGASTREVGEAILATVAEFRVRAEPVGSPHLAAVPAEV